MPSTGKLPWLLLLSLAAATASADCSPSPEETGRQLTESLNRRDAAQAGKLVNGDALLKRINFGADDAPLQAILKKDLDKHVAELWTQHIAPGSVIRLQRVQRQFDGAKLQLRLTQTTSKRGGFNYFELQLDRQSCVVDWFNHGTAIHLSALLRRLFGMMIDDPVALGQRLGPLRPTPDNTATMERLANYNRAKDYPNAYRVLDDLPEAFKRRSEWRLMRITTAMQFDENLYRKELQALAEQFGDQPQFQFMLVDHYLFREEPQRAYQALQSLERTLGRDAVLLSLQANMLTLMGKHAEALAISQQAIELEPDQPFAYMAQLTSALLARDHKTSLSALDQLAIRFGNKIDPERMRQEPLYLPLLDSPEYADWSKKNAAREAGAGRS